MLDAQQELKNTLQSVASHLALQGSEIQGIKGEPDETVTVTPSMNDLHRITP